jgi:hypothetical protein
VGGGTGDWLVYFLLVWAGLVVLSAVLSAALGRAFLQDRPSGEAEDN